MTITVTKLEADIIHWFRSDDRLYPLEEIREHFPDVPEKELLEALDSLCDLGVIYGGTAMILDMYGLR